MVQRIQKWDEGMEIYSDRWQIPFYNEGREGPSEILVRKQVM